MAFTLPLEVTMPAKIRWVKLNQVYESSVRTVDRMFLFKPNHHPDNPLLAESCPVNALDPNNDIIPEPSIINTIGSAVGRALEKHPIQIHCFEAGINHLHEEFFATDEQVDHLADFFRTVHSLIARGVNKTWLQRVRRFGLSAFAPGASADERTALDERSSAIARSATADKRILIDSALNNVTEKHRPGEDRSGSGIWTGKLTGQSAATARRAIG